VFGVAAANDEREPDGDIERTRSFAATARVETLLD
jgi:hypothetical protein